MANTGVNLLFLNSQETGLKIVVSLRALVMLFVILTTFALSYAQGAGGRAGAFLRMGAGARAKAMGNASTALAQGIDAGYYNPAGLPFLQDREVFLSYRMMSLGRQYTVIGFGMPIRPKAKGNEKILDGGFSLTWTRAGTNDIDGRNTDGFRTAELSNSENAFSFAFALNPAARFSIGLVVKVLWNRFPGIGQNSESISASGVGFDFGALYSPVQWISLGMTIKDINSKYRWNTEALYDEDATESIDTFPKSFRMGLALHPQRYQALILVADYEQLFDTSYFKDKIDDRFYFGLETSLIEQFALRAGFDDGALTAGLGYAFPLFSRISQINYGYIAANDRPEAEHIFTWILRF
jgi:hypothetical protein